MAFECPICGEMLESDDGSSLNCQKCDVMMTLVDVTLAPDSDASEPDFDLAAENQTVEQQNTGASRQSVLHQLVGKNAGQPQDSQVSIASDKYSKVDHIAVGGMGRVDLVQDHDVNRRVAMKSALPKLSKSRMQLAKFIREAQIVGQLEHPNIVPLYDVGSHENGELYFTMKYIQGRTLEEIIKSLAEGNPEDHRQFSWQRRAMIIQQLCAAVEFAHRKGIVHRDLKPANVMLGPFGEVVVMDWGLAKRIGSSDDDSEPVSVEATELEGDQTQHGMLKGTPAYMSPEQARGEPATPLSDVYAIGAMTYELFGLKQPHEKAPLEQLLRSVVNDTPPRVESHKYPFQGSPPIEIQYIVSHALAKEPEKRQQSAAELESQLQLFLDGKFPVTCPHTAMKCVANNLAREIDNHPRRTAFILFGILAAIGIGIGMSFW